MDKLIHEIRNIVLHHPFPYRDTHKIQVDFDSSFNKLREEENSFTADFNTYCMNIAGTLSYVFNGTAQNIPQRQIEMLEYSFFDMFPQYRFIEGSIIEYHEFFRKYENFDKTRVLLIKYLESK